MCECTKWHGGRRGGADEVVDEVADEVANEVADEVADGFLVLPHLTYTAV